MSEWPGGTPGYVRLINMLNKRPLDDPQGFPQGLAPLGSPQAAPALPPIAAVISELNQSASGLSDDTQAVGGVTNTPAGLGDGLIHSTEMQEVADDDGVHLVPVESVRAGPTNARATNPTSLDPFDERKKKKNIGTDDPLF